MPTWKDLAESERLEVVYRHEIEHESWGVIAQRFGITSMHYDRMAQYYIIKLKAAGEWPPDKPLEFPRIAPSPKKKHLDALRIEGDALILDDPHVPYHDATFINRCIRLAVKWGIGASTSGRYCTVDSGMCGDPERISYNMEEDNIRPAMQQGAVIIRQGYPWLLHPRFTDWERLERA